MQIWFLFSGVPKSTHMYRLELVCPEKKSLNKPSLNNNNNNKRTKKEPSLPSFPFQHKRINYASLSLQQVFTM